MRLWKTKRILCVWSARWRCKLPNVVGRGVEHARKALTTDSIHRPTGKTVNYDGTRTCYFLPLTFANGHVTFKHTKSDPEYRKGMVPPIHLHPLIHNEIQCTEFYGSTVPTTRPSMESKLGGFYFQPSIFFSLWYISVTVWRLHWPQALSGRHSSSSQEIVMREMAYCSDPARWVLLIGRGGKHDLLMRIWGRCTIGSSSHTVRLLRFVTMAILLGFLNYLSQGFQRQCKIFFAPLVCMYRYVSLSLPPEMNSDLTIAMLWLYFMICEKLPEAYKILIDWDSTNRNGGNTPQLIYSYRSVHWASGNFPGLS